MSSELLWLPSIISDNMVVQAGVRAAIWGKCHPGQRVRVEIAGKSASATANDRGDFVVRLPALKPGGPHQLRIQAGAERVIENVLVGDVWLGSGQSNMEWLLGPSKDGPREIQAAMYPKIRLFTVTPCASRAAESDVQGRWQECSPDTAGDFSAVLYFFGREVHQATGTPIGLVNSSWGGTDIEPWISLSSLKRFSGYRKLVAPFKAELNSGKSAGPVQGGFHKDKCNKGVALGWASEACDEKLWQKIVLPAYWTQHVPKVGPFWFRKTVTIPPAWRGQEPALGLGPIVDFDNTYFNGQRVGGIGPECRGAWDMPRRYTIPAAMVKPGKNVIAVRAFAHNVNGGFTGPAGLMNLSVINRADLGTISLAGAWRYRPEAALDRVGRLGQALVPSTLYNSMIHPLRQFALKGWIWWQGENNVPRHGEYRELSGLLIDDWREQWGDARLPFYFVQLEDYGSEATHPNLPLFREVQAATLTVPHTGMAVTVDGGEKDVHPRNKQLSGHRLAVQALAKTYGKPIEWRGPVFASFVVAKGKVRVALDHAKGLATRDGKKPLAFALAGEDRRFVSAMARIDGQGVVLSSPDVPAPVAVRYAWSAAPQCNLVNGAALPAEPFRTDAW